MSDCTFCLTIRLRVVCSCHTIVGRKPPEKFIVHSIAELASLVSNDSCNWAIASDDGNYKSSDHISNLRWYTSSLRPFGQIVCQYCYVPIPPCSNIKYQWNSQYWRYCKQFYSKTKTDNFANWTNYIHTYIYIFMYHNHHHHHLHHHL